MKKFLFTVAVLLFVATGYSQFTNSWIDYSKTYYKFKVGKDTLCRISQATLQSAGLGSTPAQNFQLWRNGKEVRIYTSVASGTLGAGDFIEFWGERNDGKPDKDLYRNPDYQLDDKYSLFTDTATYYLTVNPAGGNLRYTQTANPVATNVLPADAYFMRRLEAHFKDALNPGFSEYLGESVYSSAYDINEGWTSKPINSCCLLTQSFTNINKYAAGPANSVTFTIAASGNSALYTRNLTAKFYDVPVMPLSPMPYYSYRKDTIRNLPLSVLPNLTSLVIAAGGESSSNPGNDYVSISSMSVTYPATFNFNNEKNFYFELAASATGNFLVINNFNNNGTAPILYDISNGLRYLGDISTAGQVKFALPASSITVRKFNLMSQDATNINAVAQVTSKTFVNYNTAANQGDYIIISNPALYDNGSGINYVDQYKQYRSSVAGGGYNAKVYDVNELTEQFGYGIKLNPAAIRDFMRFASQQFTVKPKYILLLGRAVSYFEYKNNEYKTTGEYNTDVDKLCLVPTFGWPASDVLLVSNPGTQIPIAPVGRLGAINGNEVGNYLQKIKEYELAQKSTSQTIADKAWMKNFIHVAGGSDTLETASFNSHLQQYKIIAEDTLMGAHVETFAKSSSGPVQDASSARIEQLFKEGLGYITYFGHSSANTLAFNFSNPEIYQNQGKYPFFNVSGCSAGNFFNYDPTRLSGNMSLSEKYIFAQQKGSIGFFADTHFGIEPFLDYFNTDNYTQFCNSMYGATVGDQLKKVSTDLSTSGSLNYYTRIHLEELALHGDPALRINYFTKPDYVMEEQLIKISPSIITVADNSFNLDVKMMNIGSVVNDSIRVTIKRKLPNDSVTVLYDSLIRGIRNTDSVSLVVPINPLTDKGLNKIMVSLDVNNKVAELSETNNTAEKEFYIYEDELRPVYPYNYSIVNQQNITFTGTTANPLVTQRQYTMEVDTTELFNSSFKKTYSVSGVGGIVEFKPTNITFTDSTVYYWRTSVVPSGSSTVVWNSSSFIYLPASSAGFNQSHYYQHLKSTFTDLNYSAARDYKFNPYVSAIRIKNGVFPTAASFADDFTVDVNGLSNIQSVCGISNIIINVFNPIDMTAMQNVLSGPGLYNSDAVCGPTRRWNFQFNILDQAKRISAVQFLDQIPAGSYVVIRNTSGAAVNSNTYANDWMNDTLVMGSGNSLYHRLKNAGFAEVDSFNRPRAFNFIYKKNDNTFVPQWKFSVDIYDKIDMEVTCSSLKGTGSIVSPLFGPAKSWEQFHWRGKSVEAVSNDSVSFNIIGVTPTGTETTLLTIDSTTKDVNISSIDAVQYPYVKLKMFTKDIVTGSPYQLRYWRLNYKAIPEGAVAPNISYQMKDTADQGELVDFKVAFKNISPTAFDSAMKFKMTITDNKNFPNIIPLPKGKVLISGDTLMVQYKIDTKNFPGNNTLFLDVNPNNDQLEQSHFNNVLFKDFYVKPDNYNPLLDVTFDGVHILNKDIVAAKPHINIKLKDESRFMALSDTSLMKVQVIYPDKTVHNYNFGDTMRFNPANLASGQNTASIDMTPYFPLDGDYELVVSGKDVVGNKAGNLEYRVVFSVINKPMISNMLNYPNPFTTSTAFVFTVTGSEVPQNMRIQILTISGKVVREITKAELGPIHIGRNITDYKWDGTDTYGQKLANGVYLYRVITNLNGKSLDKYKEQGDKTDQFFNNGYGKMVIIR
jgi:hypothetical protein